MEILDIFTLKYIIYLLKKMFFIHFKNHSGVIQFAALCHDILFLFLIALVKFFFTSKNVVISACNKQKHFSAH